MNTNKMIVTKIKNSFEDDRGVIRDIMVHTPVDALTYITFKKDAVRGNHYHNKTMQYDYILSGSLICRSRQDDSSKIEEKIVVAGDYIVHPFPHRHAYKALEDSAMLSATLGPRQGEEFESDVVRLAEKDKLIS